MKLDKAFQALGLSEGTTFVEIRTAYEEKKKNLEFKKENAQTPALAKKFDAMLQKLDDAYQSLQADQDNKNQNMNDEKSISSNKTSSLSQNPLSQTKLADLPGMAGVDTTPVELQPGEILASRYEIKELVGQGGMGVVYRAFDKNRDEDIAIKMLLPQLTKNESAKQRFLEEARLSSQLSHPNIVNVFDVQIDNDLCFLTMELLEGQELRAYLTNLNILKQDMPIEEAKRIIIELLTALEHAHQTTVHRDIKPENIWLMPNGQIKLMDFGIARLMSTTQRTQTGAATGTAYYMAPEQLQGKDVDARADLYAVGVLLYEMLTGQIPMGRFASAIEHRKEIGKGLSSVIDQVLEVNPEQRFASASLLKQVIQQGKQGKVKKSQTANNQLTHQGPNKGVIAAVILFFVICLGFAGVNGHLDFLKPIDKELLAEKQSEGNKLLGQIKTLRKRLDNKFRELKSDVKDAERNNAANLRHIQQWQELTLLHIEESDDLVDLEGDQNAAEARFKAAKTVEQISKAIAKLQGVKEQTHTLVSRFDNIEAYLLQIPKTAQSKQAFLQFKSKYQITETPSQESEGDKLTKQAKEFKIDSLFVKTNNALKQAQRAYDDGLNCCKTHIASVKAQWAKEKAEKLAREKAEKEFRGGKTIRFASTSMTFKGIPAGNFRMGSNNGDDDEKPMHKVNIKAFYMQEHELTWAQYQPCIDAGKCPEITFYLDDAEQWPRERRPVINVSWNDIQTYLKWLNSQGVGTYRLPSEAEWEYAARAGSTTKYYWGDSINCSQARYGHFTSQERFKGECGNQNETIQVKSFSPNAFGLYDMYGNLSELVEDCWNDSYHGAPINGSAWQSGDCKQRVVRGGSWLNQSKHIYSASRFRTWAGNKSIASGFRLVRGG